MSNMVKIKCQLTLEMINEAELAKDNDYSNPPSECPLYRAIKPYVPLLEGIYGSGTDKHYHMRIDPPVEFSVTVEIPKEIGEIAYKFDTNLPIEPTEFELEIPGEYCSDSI